MDIDKNYAEKKHQQVIKLIKERDDLIENIMKNRKQITTDEKRLLQITKELDSILD